MNSLLSLLVEEIRGNLEGKSTEELLAIWKDNNRDEWREEAFEAIRLILLQREQTVPDQDPTPIHPSSLPPNERAAYLQGYNDYKLSIQGNVPSISKSYYNPPVEGEAVYKAGWEKAAEEYHEQLASREGGAAIILGIVAIVSGIIVILIMGTGWEDAQGDERAWRGRATIMGMGLLVFGIFILIRGLKTR